MIKVQLCALALAGLLSTAALAGATGPTNPVEGPKSPATQGTPKININPPAMDEGSLPPATGTDPRIQGNDNGRQGGVGTMDSSTPDSGKTGTGSKTTTGGSGSEGSSQ
ncbi:hypothetical protein D3X12_13855 [Pseudomonas protegens]|jgi:hypothetical protein|uniref:Lipoprotein n=4 Tax=Pseudomonas TaxID=286 RepID=Q4KFQ0_PSEF5|nr:MULTISPECIES: hypothetical protein [Pseudomonas]BCQ60505.1 hypothetical protein PBOI14_22550 [Pseudomonas sp. Boi14]GED78675.1 hypothetical protein PFL02_55250 [Pseudomonas fluorescens]AAY91102.1 conserved hypothetical protein [Pseudomonas protegens Pf-5]AGL83631.1 hypothetical protein PFLCHA0_c18490 [Pseudomonas protegens CHA0]APC20724.1 hypothetical protein BME99_09555 [Pseudomonas protegens]